jgi:hypothetical protein
MKRLFLREISMAVLFVLGACSRKESETRSASPEPVTTAPARDPAEPVCDQETVREIAKVYALSVPMWNGSLEDPIGPNGRLVRYVKESSERFASGGKTIVCARALSGKLMGAGGGRKPVGETFSNASPEVLSKIPTDVGAGSVDSTTVGLELAWLADTLPRVALGDLEPYNTTGTPIRRRIREVLPAYRERLTNDPTMFAALNRAQAQARSGLEHYLMAVAALL